MSISAIHHVAITVSDLERAVAFYRDALGFRKVLDMKVNMPQSARMLRLPRDVKGRSIMMAQASSTVGEIELLQIEPLAEKQTPRKRANDLGTWLLSFEVKDEPIEEVINRLRGMGVKFFSDLEEIDLEGYAPIKAVIFEDPDGNLLELVQLPSKDEYLRIKKEREAQQAAK
jgi:lactoylglutathione lyase